jgi:hypothetical protein
MESDGNADAKMEWKPKTPSPNKIVRENGGANMRGKSQQDAANDLPPFAAFAPKNLPLTAAACRRQWPGFAANCRPQ